MMALTSDDGEVEGFVKILRDRTEQRENEERQRVLMHELSHRMKNTLAVVQAITSQSFRNASSLEEAEQSISARINAYSKAYDILLQQNWLGTTMGTIVESTAINLGLQTSGRFKASGPDVELGHRRPFVSPSCCTNSSPTPISMVRFRRIQGLLKSSGRYATRRAPRA